MLKLTKIVLLGAVAVAGMGTTAANAATATGTAKVNIISAVTLTETTQMDLGVVASSATAGTVVLPDSSNTRTCSGGVTCIGTAARGAFEVSGAATGYVISYNVAASTSLTGPGAAMALTLDPSGTATSTGTFTATAAATTFYVGGSLSVAANQAAGTYTGTYAVTANYQ